MIAEFKTNLYYDPGGGAGLLMIIGGLGGDLSKLLTGLDANLEEKFIPVLLIFVTSLSMN